jgi:hypothetical protein
MPSLTLIPSKAAVKRGLAGFQQGKPLKLNFSAGEYVKQPLNRFNEFRMPENQIEQVFTDSDLTQTISLQTQLFGDLSVFVS